MTLVKRNLQQRNQGQESHKRVSCVHWFLARGNQTSIRSLNVWKCTYIIHSQFPSYHVLFSARSLQLRNPGRLCKDFARDGNLEIQHLQNPPTHPTSQQVDAEDDSIEFDVGGFGDEDEGNEWFRMLNNPSKPLKVKSIAAVAQTVCLIYVLEHF